MQIQNIPLIDTGQMHAAANDYLSHPSLLSEYINYLPDLKGLEQAIIARQKYPINRSLLVERLNAQYQELNANFFNENSNNATKQNIALFSQENSFCITTGHQLNIFTGPLYFIYKICSAISYAKSLKNLFPEKNFIPVYWMASEDHDFDEINHFHLFGKTLKWDIKPSGAVGKISLQNPDNADKIQEIIQQLSELISRQTEGQYLLDIFRKGYTQNENLAQATRYIVHELFKNDGLVIIDADDASFKKQLIPILKQDIFEKKFHPLIEESKKQLELKYNSVPVNPRTINVFYLGKDFRVRITENESGYQAENIKNWTAEELLLEINNTPENFSPNVVIRPMYQELILPNLAYIGGTNEITYWLELKSAFEAGSVFFPQLIIRDSALWIGKKFAKDMELFKLEVKDFFRNKNEIKQAFYNANDLKSPIEDDLEKFAITYEELKLQAQKLSSDIASQLVKMSNEHLKDIKNIGKEIRKKKEEENEKSLVKIDKIFYLIFPENNFQERYDNFIPYYLQYGEEFFNIIKDYFNPLKAELKIFLDK